MTATAASNLSALAGADPRKGTAPDDLVSAAKKIGLSAELRQGMTVDDLTAATADGSPVICAVQSTGDGWTEGHYVVVLGVGDKSVIIQDPAEGRKRVGKSLWDARWHDQGGNGEKYDHCGIVVSRGNVAKGIAMQKHFFETCDRDEHGRCKADGESGMTPEQAVEFFSPENEAELHRQYEALEAKRDYNGMREHLKAYMVEAVKAFEILPGEPLKAMAESPLLSEMKSTQIFGRQPPSEAKQLPDGRWLLRDGDVVTRRDEGNIKAILSSPASTEKTVEITSLFDPSADELKRTLKTNVLKEEWDDPEFGVREMLPEGSRYVGDGMIVLPEGSNVKQEAKEFRSGGGFTARGINSQEQMEEMYRTLTVPEKRYHLRNREYTGAETKSEHDKKQPIGRRINDKWTLIYDPDGAKEGFYLADTAKVEAKDAALRAKYKIPESKTYRPRFFKCGGPGSGVPGPCPSVQPEKTEPHQRTPSPTETPQERPPAIVPAPAGKVKAEAQVASTQGRLPSARAIEKGTRRPLGHAGSHAVSVVETKSFLGIGVTGKFVVKDLASEFGEHSDAITAERKAVNETVMADLKRRIGLPAPAVAKVELNGQPHLVSEHVGDLPTMTELSVPEQVAAMEKVGEPTIHTHALLDWVTSSTDRNTGNYFIAPDGRLVSIDHEHSFKPGADLLTSLAAHGPLRRLHQAYFDQGPSPSVVEHVDRLRSLEINKQGIDAVLAARPAIEDAAKRMNESGAAGYDVLRSVQQRLATLELLRGEKNPRFGDLE